MCTFAFRRGHPRMSREPLKPLFIFSLPRSGSTLLQRALASHEDISTVSEPWLLLPLIYPLRASGVYAEYSHAHVHAALQDFITELPEGEKDYLAAVRNIAMELYQKASTDEATYFLDKTPRYHLITEKIMQAFPNGKFIFLWRNPLSIIASMIETWGQGSWNLYHFKVDLYDGMEHLIRSAGVGKEDVLFINYEAFCQQPEEELVRISGYLNIKLNPGALKAFFNVKLRGSMGDPSGVYADNIISGEMSSKWKRTLSNPWRKWWCRKYLRWLGKDRLRFMGYDYDGLLRELSETPTTLAHLFSDILRGFYGVAYCLLEPTIMKQKWKSLPSWKRLKKHS